MKQSTTIRFIIVFLITTCTYPKNNAQRVPGPGSAPPGNWILQPDFSDEFNEPALDTSKWDNDVEDWGKWSWEPYNAYLKDGSLHLRKEYNEYLRQGEKLYYKSGIIRSRAEPVRSGEIVSKTVELQPKVMYLKILVENPDDSHEITDINITATLGG